MWQADGIENDIQVAILDMQKSNAETELEALKGAIEAENAYMEKMKVSFYPPWAMHTNRNPDIIAQPDSNRPQAELAAVLAILRSQSADAKREAAEAEEEEAARRREAERRKQRQEEERRLAEEEALRRKKMDPQASGPPPLKLPLMPPAFPGRWPSTICWRRTASRTAASSKIWSSQPRSPPSTLSPASSPKVLCRPP